MLYYSIYNTRAYYVVLKFLKYTFTYIFHLILTTPFNKEYIPAHLFIYFD